MSSPVLHSESTLVLVASTFIQFYLSTIKLWCFNLFNYNFTICGNQKVGKKYNYLKKNSFFSSEKQTDRTYHHKQHVGGEGIFLSYSKYKKNSKNLNYPATTWEKRKIYKTRFLRKKRKENGILKI